MKQSEHTHLSANFITLSVNNDNNNKDHWSQTLAKKNIITMKFLKYCSDGDLVTKSCLTLVTPWTGASQAPLSMGFSRQDYWRGLPFPSPGDLHNPDIEPRSPALQADSLLTELRGN